MESSFKPPHKTMRDWEEVAWIEVWFNPVSPANYIYVLRQLDNGTLEIIDPQQREIAGTFDSYMEANIELVSDECVLVEGRVVKVETDSLENSCLLQQEPGRTWREVAWVEIWFDSSDPANYLYILRQLVNGTYEIVDPQRQRISGIYQTYEEANIELVSDECVRVEGRIFNEEEE